MPTTTKTRSKPKTPRTLNYNRLVGSLHITDGNVSTGYWLDRLTSDFGTAYRFTKIVTPTDGSPSDYDVLLSEDGSDDACPCMGFMRWGKCRHLSALRCLRGRGSL